jgi:PAS domain S-box-containing protein
MRCCGTRTDCGETFAVCFHRGMFERCNYHVHAGRYDCQLEYRAENIYGYFASEAVGRPRVFLLPAGQPDELPAILEMLKRGERTSAKETVHIGKDHRQVEISEMLSAVKDTSGKIVGVVAITRDLSERRT